MLMLLSPSKTLDFESPLPKLTTTTPEFLPESKRLIAVLKKKSVNDIKKLMDVSDKLAALNTERYRNFNQAKTRPALFAFKGDVYEPLSLAKYGKKELAYANQHLRMLSGLYGLLKPLDEIAPYRLEMGTDLAISKSKCLYEFWGNKVTENVNIAIQEHKDKTIINLASNEYFSAINQRKLNPELLTINFKENKNGEFKTIGLFAKRARGLMADFAILNHIENPDDFKGFTGEGYAFNSRLSNKKEWVFVRNA